MERAEANEELGERQVRGAGPRCGDVGLRASGRGETHGIEGRRKKGARGKVRWGGPVGAAARAGCGR